MVGVVRQRAVLAVAVSRDLHFIARIPERRADRLGDHLAVFHEQQRHDDSKVQA